MDRKSLGEIKTDNHAIRRFVSKIKDRSPNELTNADHEMHDYKYKSSFVARLFFVTVGLFSIVFILWIGLGIDRQPFAGLKAVVIVSMLLGGVALVLIGCFGSSRFVRRQFRKSIDRL